MDDLKVLTCKYESDIQYRTHANKGVALLSKCQLACSSCKIVVETTDTLNN